MPVAKQLISTAQLWKLQHCELQGPFDLESAVHKLRHTIQTLSLWHQLDFLMPTTFHCLASKHLWNYESSGLVAVLKMTVKQTFQMMMMRMIILLHMKWH